MTTLSVVIPTYNHYDLLHRCLYDLYQNCRNSLTEVLVVNDASTDDTVYQGLQFWKENNMLPIRELRLKKNHMFLRASNKGMKRATGEILVLLSNDVLVKADVCKQITEVIEANRKSLVGGKLLDWNTGWNTFDGRIFPYLEGWLLACTGEAWDELGGFDDQYAPSDFEDVDLSTKALSLGYSLVPLNNPKVTHIGGQSIRYGTEREKITIANKEKFKVKWTK